MGAVRGVLPRLRVRGSGPGNLAEFQNSAGLPTLIRPAGEVSIIPTNAASASTPLQVVGANPANKVLLVSGAASQTGNLAEFTSAGSPVLVIGGRGAVTISAVTVGQYALDVLGQTPADTVARIRGAVNQSATLMDFQNSAGTLLANFRSDGSLTVGTSTVLLNAASFGASLNTMPVIAGAVGLMVRGFAGQIGNLAEFQNSAGQVVAAIGAGGTVDFAAANLSADTSVTTPLGGILIRVNGSIRRLVYY